VLARHLALTLTLAALGRPAAAQVQYEVAFPNLSFSFPVDVRHAGDGSDRIFVVEQGGLILVFPNNPAVTSATVFLDISSQLDVTGTEEGLLGMAFHPEYPDSPYFYVDYTAGPPDRTVISRFTVSSTNPDSVIAGSEFILLEFPRFSDYHNGGCVAFGPDGFLYIAPGDGANSGWGQTRTDLLGSVLRIDVDATQDTLNYAIPPDNPFVGNLNGYREEIYAWGFRNPWRFSFDFPTGRLWLGDVGQNLREEIDIVESGNNYGWDIWEGTFCLNPPCTTTGLTSPIWDYGHPPGGAVVGGYVYRGSLFSGAVGRYIYGDFNSGMMWMLDYDGVNPPSNTLLADTDLLISSFGVDESQELYFCSWLPGEVYKLTQIPTGIGDTPPAPISLDQNVPNPFNAGTRIRYMVPEATRVRLAVYDVAGGLVATLVDGVVGQGEHIADWDARGLPSGVYYCLLTAGHFSQSLKMTHLK
jgi:glucose/arabinose dehydrogenase